MFPSAISRYLVSDVETQLDVVAASVEFPSAISRYLVSDISVYVLNGANTASFHPLYRGTWFPTGNATSVRAYCAVSIRYIAVLGFQPLLEVEELVAHVTFPSAISRYLVSNGDADF